MDTDSKIEVKKAQLAVQRAIASLITDERWAAFASVIDRNKQVVANKLLTREMSPYETGFNQGFYRFLSMIGQTKEQNESSILEIEGELSSLEQPDPLRAALEAGELPQARKDELLELLRQLNHEDTP